MLKNREKSHATCSIDIPSKYTYSPNAFFATSHTVPHLVRIKTQRCEIHLITITLQSQKLRSSLQEIWQFNLGFK